MDILLFYTGQQASEGLTLKSPIELPAGVPYRIPHGYSLLFWAVKDVSLLFQDAEGHYRTVAQ